MLCQAFLASCMNAPPMKLREDSVPKSRAWELLTFLEKACSMNVKDEITKETISGADWLRFLNSVIDMITKLEEHWHTILPEFEESQKRPKLSQATLAKGVLNTATAWCGFMQVLHETEISDEHGLLRIAAQHAFEIVSDAAAFLTDIQKDEGGEGNKADPAILECLACHDLIYQMLDRFKSFRDKNLQEIDTPFETGHLDSQWFGYWSGRMNNQIRQLRKRKSDALSDTDSLPGV